MTQINLDTLHHSFKHHIFRIHIECDRGGTPKHYLQTKRRNQPDENWLVMADDGVPIVFPDTKTALEEIKRLQLWAAEQQANDVLRTWARSYWPAKVDTLEGEYTHNLRIKIDQNAPVKDHWVQAWVETPYGAPDEPNEVQSSPS